jgi:hypothetical protein
VNISPRNLALIAVATMLGTATLAVVSTNSQTLNSQCYTFFRRNVDTAAKSYLASTRLTTAQRRAIARLDSMARMHCTPNAMWSTLPLFSVGNFDTADTATTVCAHVERQDGNKFIGVPVLRVRPSGDSATFTVRGGNPLAQMCAQSYQRANIVMPTDSIPVEWSWQWVNLPEGRRWRPFAALP